MLLTDQKIKLVEALNEELKNTPHLISIIYFPATGTDKDFVEIITEETAPATSLLNIYHTLNIAGLRCTNKLDDVDFEDENGKWKKYVDIYYFEF